MREMISPVKPRPTASGLHRIKVRWIAITARCYGPRASGACTPKAAQVSHFSRIVRVETTGSTNDDVAAMLGEARARGLIFVAEYQTAGAGRRGRAWIAPPNTALLCTLALPEPVRTRNLWLAPFWSGLVVHAALASLGVHTVLQWPNDVLFERRKISGILCVSRISGELAWIGCGIGINVIRPDDESAFAQLQAPPAFVSDTVHADVEHVLERVAGYADELYDLIENERGVLAAWQRRAQLPKPYRILKDNEAQPFDATALRVVSGGALVVERDGREETVTLADARVLR